MHLFDTEDEDDDITDENFSQEPEVQTEDQVEQEPQEQQAPVAQQPHTIDHDAIARTVASTIQQYQQPAPERQFTPEEIAQHFQIWNPDERYVNDLNKLTDPEVPLAERQMLLAQMRDGMVAQAHRSAELLIEQKLSQFSQQVAPAVRLAEERAAKQAMKTFETKYPGLKGQSALVNAISAQLGAQGFKPKSQDEAFEKVAKTAESILKQSNPAFALKPAGAPNGMPAMAKTNMGGQTGGHQTAGQKPAGKRGGLASIFS